MTYSRTKTALAIVGLGVLACGVLFACRATEQPGAGCVVLRDVDVVDVRSGAVQRGQTIVVRGLRVAAIGPSSVVRAPRGALEVDGRGKFVVPGLWDMHVHSHRDQRWEHHHPLFVAHGVTGVREMGTHLASILALRESVSRDELAPRVDWTSPVIDGAPPVLSHALAAEDAPSARKLVQALASQGFRTLKVYDRLTPQAYFAVSDEARALGLRVVGHVPLRLTPFDVARAGQRSIEHLTLVLEACIPGALEWSAADSNADSLALLADGRLAGALDQFDAERAKRMCAAFVEHDVWQTPTLVQMRGAFHCDELAMGDDARLRLVPQRTRSAWESAAREADPASLKAGRAVLARQIQLVGELHAAGVGVLAGTDTSDEPWVFAGSSLHDELALLVAAGLSPLDALRTATWNPAQYRGDTAHEGHIAVGVTADLVLLAADPTKDIRNLRRIEGVCLRGKWLERVALDGLIESAALRAASSGTKDE